jgi:molybdopterin-guanine dinucleotide biosynthesis protein A
MLARAIRVAMSLSEDVVIVVGSEAQAEAYGSEIPSQLAVVRDKIPEKGPLVALYTGLERVRSEYAAILPCDSPFVKRSVVRHLLGLAEGADAVVPAWHDGRIEPLHSVFRVHSTKKATVEALKDQSDTIREMIQLLDKVRFVPVESFKQLDPELLSFFNVNTRDDLDKARRIFASLRDRNLIAD